MRHHRPVEDLRRWISATTSIDSSQHPKKCKEFALAIFFSLVAQITQISTVIWPIDRLETNFYGAESQNANPPVQDGRQVGSTSELHGKYRQ